MNFRDKHDVPTPRTDALAGGFRRQTVGAVESAIEWAKKLERELAEKTDRLNAALIRLKGLHGLRLEGEPKPIDNSRFFKEQKSEAPQENRPESPASRQSELPSPAVASPPDHSCSYFCDRPECIKAQRDELRDRAGLPSSEKEGVDGILVAAMDALARRCGWNEFSSRPTICYIEDAVEQYEKHLASATKEKK